VTEQDLKRAEIRIAKSKRGFKNVDAILEDKLFRDERPKVALVFASTSITMDDFNAGVNAAAVKIDFTEQRQSFGNATKLAAFLKSLDSGQFDTIALIRGGGNGIEALDEIEVLQIVSEMKTAVICAIGHVGEELFMKSIADKVAPTPNGLGQYFSEMVERVSAKRNNSRAALVEEVRKQFIKQIEESNKKNKELLEQVGKLTKQGEEQRKSFDQNLKKQQEENKKALDAVQEQNKKQMETVSKQNTDLQKQLQNLTNSQKQQFDSLTKQNREVQAKLEKEQQHSRDLERQMANQSGGSKWIAIAIAALLAGFLLAKLIL